MYGRLSNSHNGLPPGPKLPPKAQALKWIGQPYEFLRDCARAFGDAFTLDMGLDDGKYVVLSHPDAVRGIVTADVGALRVCNSVLSPLLGPRSLLLLDGDEHLRERKLLMPAFQHRSIAAYADIIHRVLSAATAHWSEGSVFVAQEFLQDVSLEVILRVTFGEDAADRCSALKAALMAVLNDPRLGLAVLGRAGESGTLPALGAFWQKFERVRDLALDLVERTRSDSPGPSNTILSLLLQAKDEQGRGRTDEELRDEVLTLLVTGHETTATAMSWGLYWLAQLGEPRERLRSELAQEGRWADPMAIGQLPYLDATCKEILRIYPIVPALFRQVVGRPFKLCGYAFEPGTFLSPSIYLTHHRPELYPDPDCFDPTRFLARTYSAYEYLPFGGGARRCVGMHLAVFEMKIVLAALFSRYDLALVQGQDAAPARRFVTVAPGERLRLTVAGARG
ncbi:MAG TPA: cytochrome P450 [Polyangiaceae bacterium]|nr:cytochrome P450 [Polyangiaceae bacterium]